MRILPVEAVGASIIMPVAGSGSAGLGLGVAWAWTPRGGGVGHEADFARGGGLGLSNPPHHPPHIEMEQHGPDCGDR